MVPSLPTPAHTPHWTHQVSFLAEDFFSFGSPTVLAVQYTVYTIVRQQFQFPDSVRQCPTVPTVRQFRQSDSPTAFRQFRQLSDSSDGARAGVSVRQQSDSPTAVRQPSDSPTVRQSDSRPTVSDSPTACPTVPTVPTARAQLGTTWRAILEAARLGHRLKGY